MALTPPVAFTAAKFSTYFTGLSIAERAQFAAELGTARALGTQTWQGQSMVLTKVWAVMVILFHERGILGTAEWAQLQSLQAFWVASQGA